MDIVVMKIKTVAKKNVQKKWLNARVIATRVYHAKYKVF